MLTFGNIFKLLKNCKYSISYQKNQDNCSQKTSRYIIYGALHCLNASCEAVANT